MRMPDEATGRITILGEARRDRAAPWWARSMLIAVGTVLLATTLLVTGSSDQDSQTAPPPNTEWTRPATPTPASLDAWAVLWHYRATGGTGGAIVVAASTARGEFGLGGHTAAHRRAAMGFGLTVVAWRERSFSFVVAARGASLIHLLDVAAGIEMVPTGVTSAPLPTPRRIPPDFVLDRVTSARFATSPGAAAG
jgi:hypothetical protein